MSLPRESLAEESDKAEQVKYWWQEIEQKSLELSLNYEYVFQTDIVDCYPSIYTHSIAWALHGKEKAKDNRRKKSFIGNIIDSHIQCMRYGQTNGIPQGSVLMDFIAEMVLGYADTELASKIECSEKVENYQILRYRDDYRIFVNRPKDGEEILKILSEVLIGLGLMIKPQKTGLSYEVVRSSIKEDKLSWMFRKQGDRDLQKHLLAIHDHAYAHPNVGSINKALAAFFNRIDRLKKYDAILPAIGIIVDIAYRNPKTYSNSAAILSRLINILGTKEEITEIVKKIQRKFEWLPNTGLMDIWLQRISLKHDPMMKYKEPICQLVKQVENPDLKQEPIVLWNNDWMLDVSLLNALDTKQIVDRDVIQEMEPKISREEFELFRYEYN